MITRKCLLPIIVVCTLFAMIGGCESKSGVGDAKLIEWLNGQKVTVAKGLIFDSVWRIEPGEISDFKVIRNSEVTPDPKYPNSRCLTAHVSFRATVKGQGIQINDGIIRYKYHAPPRNLFSPTVTFTDDFIDFVPISVSRIGN